MTEWTTDKLAQVDQTMTRWLADLGRQLRTNQQEDLHVQTKGGDFRNLVTNVDTENQAWLLEHIQMIDPDAHFVSEEGDDARPETMAGHVWFIDPIDGTMNFVHEGTDFAIMVALYVDGQPTLGWIIKVMANQVFHGGPALGAFVNDQRLAPVANDLALQEAVLILSGRRLVAGEMIYQKLAEAALAYRVVGSAGISFSRLFLQQATGYLSKLSPWDLAAGRVLAETLGYVVKTLDGSPLNMLSSNTVLIATTKTYRESVKIVKD
ncbi:archaeal fructose-1,6-bisphosphatase related enzyme of inositol monophosphatase family [Fructobacillus pseudoficulneus]|uniref:Archaeal fructose-1,6-bisphosphatase related enzyme of inositol monophosphatase family n=1 Tax=Fructobacillus pseudoficulneus TaxID=220714 RepID=A0A3F3H3C9_9LACO|nr:inositol monophosphatase family protein [Fructobacillus pseudoficulneus]GAP02610.1 archaeal fructose-1,6-bisphosphatase related enzyme of inositol monophosphatase family [Fructobacillus pseudoficulneus]SEH38546.1 myo-inositol-1(or 4)-monophosphatase [Fructobacillus pseudoficulneus]